MDVDKNVKMGAGLASNKDYKAVIEAAGFGEKLQLITALLCVAVAVAYGVLAVREIASQDRMQSLIYIGLILVFGGLAVDNYMK